MQASRIDLLRTCPFHIHRFFQHDGPTPLYRMDKRKDQSISEKASIGGDVFSAKKSYVPSHGRFLLARARAKSFFALAYLPFLSTDLCAFSFTCP